MNRPVSFSLLSCLYGFVYLVTLALPPFVVDDPRLCGRDMEFRLMKAFLWDGERNHVAVLPIMEQKIHVCLHR